MENLLSINGGWRQLWNKRGLSEKSEYALEDLIAFDGFDSGAGKVDAKDWRAYAGLIVEKLGIKEGNSIFEVGCGAGALLYAIKEYLDISISGIDYSESLINVAKVALPEGDFKVAEALEINLNKKYDFIISNSVFHYFDLKYAEEVMLKMLKIVNPGGQY